MKVLNKGELIGHDVFELQQGSSSEEYWLENSLYLTEECLVKTELNAIFRKYLVDFNYFGHTIVLKSDWVKVKETVEKSKDHSTTYVFEQIDMWAQKCFEYHLDFKIIGP
ncbi:hypothetical protein B9G55_19020 [Saccharibacillus sp. O16]|nr:hypothetical protein B9G55_19020 [Saccharibacillus sp. O16]